MNFPDFLNEMARNLYKWLVVPEIMEIVESSKNKLVLKLPEFDNTILNVLKEELRKDPAVEISAFNVDHPLIGTPKLVVETNKGEPKKAIMEAIKRLHDKNKEFADAFKKLK